MALEPGQSETYTVNFSPKSAANDAGTLIVNSNTSTLKVGLSGTGVTAPPSNLSVTLKWDPSSSKVSGYFVYRSTKSDGPYTKVNSSVDGSTSYTDSTIAAGQTYYYVVAAVSTSNVESPYSNQVEVVVPAD